MPFEFQKFDIPDLILITPKVFEDERGFFMETYKQSDFLEKGIDVEFNQDNHSKSAAKVLRGLHFQKSPHEQAKLVRCVKGCIFQKVSHMVLLFFQTRLKYATRRPVNTPLKPMAAFFGLIKI